MPWKKIPRMWSSTHPTSHHVPSTQRSTLRALHRLPKQRTLDCIFSSAGGVQEGTSAAAFFLSPPPHLPEHICDSVIHKYDLTCVACLRMSHRRWKVLNKLLMSVRQCDVRAPRLRRHQSPAASSTFLWNCVFFPL